MFVDLFLIVIPFLWLGVASVIDIKTREVPDWLSYSLVLLGLAIRAAHALLTHQPWFFLAGIIAFALAFLAGSIMYYTKQWGGGDSKLLMGIAVVFATTPASLATRTTIPFLAAFVLNLVIVGALYGIAYAGMIAFRNKAKVRRELRKPAYRFLRYAWLIIIGALILSLFIPNLYLKTIIALLLASVGMLLYLMLFTRIVERTCMHKNVPARILREGDWITTPITKNGKTLVPVRTTGLTNNDIAILRKTRIARITIKEGMPFVPAFFLAYLLTLAIGPLLPAQELATLFTVFAFAAA